MVWFLESSSDCSMAVLDFSILMLIFIDCSVWKGQLIVLIICSITTYIQSWGIAACNLTHFCLLQLSICGLWSVVCFV